MRRILIILLTPLALWAATATVWLSLLNPWLEEWTKNKIETLTRESSPIALEIGQLTIDLFTPRIRLSEVQLRPQTSEMARMIEKVQIKSIESKINAFKLLTGSADISGLLIESPILQLNIDPLLEDNSPSTEIPTEQIVKMIQRIPILKLRVSDARFLIYSKKQEFSVVTDKIQLAVEKSKGRIFARAQSEKINVTESHVGSTDVSLQAALNLDKNDISIQEVELDGFGAKAKIFGLIPNWKTLTTKPHIELQPQTHIDLPTLSRSIPFLQKLKSLGGEVESSFQMKILGDEISAQGELRTKSFEIEGFKIGDAKIMAKMTNSNLELYDVQLQHPAGNIDVNRFSVQLIAPYSYSGELQTDKLSLHDLMINLGIGKIPVWMDLKGQVSCQGNFKNLVNDCKADIETPAIVVKTGLNEQNSLLHLENLKAQGQVQINADEVKYNANLKLGSSSGKSQGSINYKSGFSINYDTEALNFNDVKNLAGLHLVGSAAIQGKTIGDSHAATFTLQADSKNFIFEKYKLGQLSTQLSYEAGILYLEKTSGAYQKTSYVGELSVDLNHSSIEGSFTLPTAEISDIAEILNHIYQVPFEIKGTGSGKIGFSGPLDFWNMNHELQAQFKNVQIYGEKFDILHVKSFAENGRINLEGTRLEKNKNLILLNGGVLPLRKLDLSVTAQNFPIEQSDIISSITNSIFGKISGSALIAGTLSNPIVTAKAQVSDTVVDEQELPPSSIDFFADNQIIKSQFSLMGSKIRGFLTCPSSEKSPSPLKINIKTDNWNFVSALAVLTGANNLKDIDSLLTSEVELSSNSGKLFQSTGSIYIPNLYLRRGNQYLSHSLPLEVQFNEGVANIKNFNLEGPGNIIKIQGENFTSDKLNLNIKAEADLRFAHILAPFLEDIGGPVSLNTTITGKLTQPQIFGFADILNGFVKIKGFPHPFERIQANVAFSQSKISISNMKAAIAGGTLNGGGSIQVLGLRNMPIAISAKLENVKFNVPEKVRTSGNADVNFTGSWFPFILSGVYKVDGAMVTKEFTESSSVQNIKQSVYLPKILKQSSFDPVVLDLQVQLERNIVIKNSLADGSASGSLTVKGAPQNPGLIGKVEFNKNSKLTFKDKIFDIITGSATFKTVDDINPELFISAQSRIGEYDVSLLVQGQAKDPNFVLSSIPPLAENDLISLLALGVTSSNLEQNVQSKDQQAQTGYEIGAAIFSNNPLNKKLSETLGWNLKFTTNFDSTRNIAIPKIVAERKISERLNATAGRTLDQGMIDFKLQYLINNNWSAIGTWEEKQPQESADATSATTKTNSPSIFGLDLEFKKEFK